MSTDLLKHNLKDCLKMAVHSWNMRPVYWS